MNHRRLLCILFLVLIPASTLAAGTDCTLVELSHLPLTRIGHHVEAGLNVGYFARTAPAGSLACLTTVDLGTPPTVLGTWSPIDCADVRDIALYEGAQDTARVAVIGRFGGANQPSQPGYYNQVIQVDVSDPANPTTLSTTYVTEAGFTAVAYDDKGEVFAGSAYGFLAVDRGMAVSVSGVSIKDILIDESLAYVLTTGAPDYLTIIDTDSLTVRSTLQVGSAPGDMELRDDGVLFFADNSQGIVAVDVSDPDAPAFLGNPGGSRLGQHIALAGDRAYVTDSYYNLVVNVYDVSDPANIVCVSTLGGGTARGVHARGTTVYLLAAFLNSSPELLTLDASDCAPVTGVGDTPAPMATLRVAPNVLRSGLAQITLRTKSALRPKPLKVVDVTGRLIERIPLQFAGDGVWTGQWDPNENGGVSSGKYWVVGETAAEAVTVLH